MHCGTHHGLTLPCLLTCFVWKSQQHIWHGLHRRPLPPAVRRQAASALLSLVTRSKANQVELLKYDARCVELFHDFLPQCGDFLTQVCWLEVGWNELHVV